MRFIYLLLKLLVKPALHLYHRSITITGKEHLRKKGPCILVSNHPATLLDPLNAAAIVPRQVHFLANAGLFASPFGKWFFSTFYCIPVQRREDTGGKPLNNEQSFAAARHFLAQGGCLFIAPESTSLPTRHLRKIKTGLARIGLAAEAEHDFQLGLFVLPIGLNYDNTRKFRPRLLANIGEPIPFAPFQKMYEQDPRSAVRAFTDSLQQHMSKLLLNTKNEEEDKLIPFLQKKLKREKQLDPYELFLHTRAEVEKWHNWQQNEPEKWIAFRQKLVQQEQEKKTNLTKLFKLKKIAFLLLGSIPALYGFLNNALPVITTCKLSDKLKPDPSYEPTFKFISALLAFPLFYTLQTLAFAKYLSPAFPLANLNFPLWPLYLISLIPSGIFYERYREWILRIDGVR